MIQEDRLALNERFIELFGMLEKKGLIVKNDRSGKGMGDLAEKILGNRAYGHIVRAFLNPHDKRCIDYRHAKAMAREFGVNEEWLLEGKGQPFGKSTPRQDYSGFRGQSRGNILLTSVEAFAGSAISADSFQKESATTFSIPGLENATYVAFPINGNSMEPIIHSGDLLVCQEINSLKDIRENEIYAVKTSGNVWIKYVQLVRDESNNLKLRLKSANYLEYDPFEEEISEDTRIYKVVRRITEV